tara:strand:- start:50 stop:730 length:681 start_codon:yes stop_codon:yes gene_type:complete
MAFKMKGNPMQRNYGIGKPVAKMMGKSDYSKVLRQDESDLKEYLIDEKGMTPSDADKQIADGAHSTSDKDFLAWYKKNKDKGGEDKGGEAKGGGAGADAMQAMMGMMGGGAAGGGETPMMLKGKQKNLDKNNNGKIDAEDFKMLKKKKGDKDEKKDKKKPPLKGYKSAAQRKAVHADKADGGKGHPDKKKKKSKKRPAMKSYGKEEKYNMNKGVKFGSVQGKTSQD